MVHPITTITKIYLYYSANVKNKDIIGTGVVAVDKKMAKIDFTRKIVLNKTIYNFHNIDYT